MPPIQNWSIRTGLSHAFLEREKDGRHSLQFPVPRSETSAPQFSGSWQGSLSRYFWCVVWFYGWHLDGWKKGKINPAYNSNSKVSRFLSYQILKNANNSTRHRSMTLARGMPYLCLWAQVPDLQLPLKPLVVSWSQWPQLCWRGLGCSVPTGWLAP